jgi:hypothetical protein
MPEVYNVNRRLLGRISVCANITGFTGHPPRNDKDVR